MARDSPDDVPRSRHNRHRSSRPSRSRSPPRRRRRTSYSESPPPRHRRDHSRSRDIRSPRREHHHSRRRSCSRSPRHARSRQALPSQDESFRGQDYGGRDANAGALERAPPKEKPNYKATGALAAASNKVTVGTGSTAQRDIVLKYHEPPEARKPSSSDQWTMFVFKGESKDPLETIQLHERSCWLFGREAAVADVSIEHPSCSKQHAVLQFRYIQRRDQYGVQKGKVKLYLLDLESENGTALNEAKVDAARYVECRSGDVVKFGDSTREYVLVLPSSK